MDGLSYISDYTNTSFEDFNASTIEPTTDGRPYPPPLLKQPITMVIILSIAYIVVFLLAIVNNSLVVAVIYRNPQMRTVTNYFIANLATADILVSIIVLPITLLTNIFTEWWWGSFLCKAAPYLQGVAVSASVNTLAAVAVERYLAIFHAHRTKITPQMAVAIICVIWCLPMAIMSPFAIYRTQKQYLQKNYYQTHCANMWPSRQFWPGFFVGALFLTCYFIPLIFISIFYLMIGVRVWKRNVTGIRGTRAERNIQRSKIKIVRMLVVVFVVFAFFWLPLYSVNLHLIISKPPSQEVKILSGIVMPIAQWLGSANSCVNPFIYCYFSESFRKSILALLKSKSLFGRITVNQHGPPPSAATCTTRLNTNNDNAVNCEL